MKISESWLREWINPALNTQEIANQLTMLGLEIDSISKAASDFTGVIVAKVTETKKHPEADRLTLCTVDDGQNLIQVVCGASNVRKNLKVALATCGANLPDGFKIKKSKLRGEESNGMLCSVSELGIEEKSSGILELPDDAPIGVDLREYLQLNDSIFDIDLTPNRADCFSVLGVARDLSAKNNLDLNFPPTKNAKVSTVGLLDVNVKEPAACPKYFGRVIRGINKNSETPIWMKEKLRRAGLRSLHPVVDILNYVMLESGQPMHAFDMQAIKGSIQVRYAKDSEKIILLNLVEATLKPDCLVIADDEKSLALAGIMGGEESAVTADTTDIFLESAFFNPLVIVNRARRFGLSSDAAQRFERGVDPQLTEIAIERATSLIKEIVGGDIGPIVAKTNNEHLPVSPKIHFNPAKVATLIGINIAPNIMQNILDRLGMQVEISGDTWLVTPPSYRFDISLEVDLIEEITRVYGFDKVKSIMPLVQVKSGNICINERLTESATIHFTGRGYREAISYSFVDSEVQELFYPNSNAKKLINPISPELAAMRVGMWPGLVASMIHNIYRQQNGIKLIESGVIFKYDASSLDTKVREEAVIAGLISGSYGELNWSEHSGKFDFYDMKGDLEGLFAKFSLDNILFVKGSHPALHPGKSATIMLADTPVGFIGALHPNLMEALELTNEVILFELSLQCLANTKLVVFQSFSKYPQTRRDLSLLVDNTVSAMDLKKATYAIVPQEYLKSFDIFDVYVGKGVPSGKKSIAISLVLQDDKATLVDEKINAIMDTILSKLVSDYNVSLRE